MLTSVKCKRPHVSIMLSFIFLVLGLQLVLGSELSCETYSNILPYNHAQCGSGNHVFLLYPTPGYDFDFGGAYIHGQGELDISGPNLYIRGEWATEDYTQFAEVDVTFSDGVEADLGRTLNCPASTGKLYSTVQGVVKLRTADGNHQRTYEFSEWIMTTPQFGPHGSGMGCCGNDGLGAWFKMPDGVFADFNLDVSQLSHSKTRELIATNHPLGSAIPLFDGQGYGLVINKMFDNPCIDNSKLPHEGYYFVNFVDVRVELSNPVGTAYKTMRMYGTVELGARFPDNSVQFLFPMSLNAHWYTPDGQFTYDSDPPTYINAMLNGGANNFGYATLTETGVADPLVVEVTPKGNPHNLQCSSDNRGYPGCDGWLMARVAHAGQYASGSTDCDVCSNYPMPVAYSDWLFIIEHKCLAPPAEMPVTPPTPPCCTSFNILPYNMVCGGNDNSHVLYLFAAGDSSYRRGRGSLVWADDKSSMTLTGFWALNDNSKSAKVSLTFSNVISGPQASLEGLVKPEGCAYDNIFEKTYYQNITGTIELFDANGAPGSQTKVYDVEKRMFAAQIGRDGSAKHGCCNQNKLGLSSWLLLKHGDERIEGDFNLDLECDNICVDESTTEVAVTNHPGGNTNFAVSDDQKPFYGLLINELFKDTCIDNGQLPVGYNSFFMEDVRAGIENDGQTLRIAGRVRAYVQVNGQVQHLFDMMLDAYWTSENPGTFTAVDGAISGKLTPDNYLAAYAVMVEVVTSDKEPLVIEIATKERDIGGEIVYIHCGVVRDTLGCEGWLMARIGQAGMYGNGEVCQRCEYPMPVANSDWLVEMQAECKSVPPVVEAPPVLPSPPCCTTFSVLPYDLFCTETGQANEDTHVLVLLDGDISFRHGRGKVIWADDKSTVTMTGYWATEDNSKSAKINVTWSDPITDGAMVKDEGCSIDSIDDKTFYRTVVGTVEISSGEDEIGIAPKIYDVERRDKDAQIGDQGSAKSGCCGEDRFGFSSWIYLKNGDEMLAADFNADLQCESVCVDDLSELAVTNHPEGGINFGPDFEDSYGLVINDLFKNTCVSNDQLPIGYNFFSMEDVRIMVDNDGQTLRMGGLVRAYVQRDDDSAVQSLFVMTLDAYWTSDVAGTFSVVNGAVVGTLKPANFQEAKAVLTEVVPAGMRPLVIEIAQKERLIDNEPVYLVCGDVRGVPGCEGWLMARIGDAGEYGNSLTCQRCDYPVPVESSDWLFKIDQECVSPHPVVEAPSIEATECSCPTLLELFIDGVMYQLDASTPIEITLDDAAGLVNLEMSTASGSAVFLKPDGGVTVSACTLETGQGSVDVAFSPPRAFGAKRVRGHRCDTEGVVDLEWGQDVFPAPNNVCRGQIIIKRNCARRIPQCKSTGDPHTKTLDKKRHHYGDGQYVNIFVSPKLIVRGEHYRVAGKVRQDQLHGPEGWVSTYQSISFTYISDAGETRLLLAKDPSCVCTPGWATYRSTTILTAGEHNCDQCAQTLTVEGPTEGVVKTKVLPGRSRHTLMHHIYFADGSHASLLKRASRRNNYVIDLYLYPNTRHQIFDTTDERGICGNWNGDRTDDFSNVLTYDTPSYTGYWEDSGDFMRPTSGVLDNPDFSTEFPVDSCNGDDTFDNNNFITPSVASGIADPEVVDSRRRSTRSRRDPLDALQTIENCDNLRTAVQAFGCDAEDIDEAIINCKIDVEASCSTGVGTACVNNAYESLIADCELTEADAGDSRRDVDDFDNICVFPQSLGRLNKRRCKCAEGFKGRTCQKVKGAKPTTDDGVKFTQKLPSNVRRGATERRRQNAESLKACYNPSLGGDMEFEVLVSQFERRGTEDPKIKLKIGNQFYDMTPQEGCDADGMCDGSFKVVIPGNVLPVMRAKNVEKFRNKVRMVLQAHYTRNRNGEVKTVKHKIDVFRMPVCNA